MQYHRKHPNRCSTVGTTKKNNDIGGTQEKITINAPNMVQRENSGPSIKSSPLTPQAGERRPLGATVCEQCLHPHQQGPVQPELKSRTKAARRVGGGRWGPLSASSACTPFGEIQCWGIRRSKVPTAVKRLGGGPWEPLSASSACTPTGKGGAVAARGPSPRGGEASSAADVGGHCQRAVPAPPAAKSGAGASRGPRSRRQ